MAKSSSCGNFKSENLKKSCKKQKRKLKSIKARPLSTTRPNFKYYSDMNNGSSILRQEDFWRFDKENKKSVNRHKGVENIPVILKKQPKANKYRERMLSERQLRKSIRNLVHDPKKYFRDVRGPKSSHFAKTMCNFKEMVNRPPPTNEENILRHVQSPAKTKKEVVDFDHGQGIKE